MLVFVSDLHFVDETAGKHNIATEAFRIFFQDIAGNVERYKKNNREIQEIKIVFLGDIFDLLRTEMWFGYPVDERPWGTNESKIEAHAETIFDAIISKNRETFDLLKKDLKKEFGFPFEPERIYIPGNHDRLCNKYPKLRDKIREALGIAKTADRFEHFFQNAEYGVFARHGHEFDKFNYEGGLTYSYEDYMRVPIGDPITTELVARLPWQIMNNSEVKKLPLDEQDALKRNFQEIENVRPFSATVEWLLYQVKNNITLKEAIEDSVDEVIQAFNDLDFVNQWYKHHDRWINPIDEADKIQAALFLLEKFKIFSSEKIMPMIEKIKDRFSKDDLLEAAPEEYKHLDNRIRYIVYGHTHDPLQAPIRIVQDPSGTKEHVYLNTGTWRGRYYKTKEGLGFINWKNLTYTVFYLKEERGTDFPAYETWTGTLKSI
ncbi:MAG: metallophosphoesterase [Syntrophorhabdaceae bacterium]|nr:metallophosphoesterase [Syntrophorhabdaceae bacterium]MDD5243203.1 metallophosphoesterase [Syntrophorhabdaceae bacterium]